MHRFSLAVILFTATVVAACGSDADPFSSPPPSKHDPSSLAAPANIRAWANSASAVAVYANIYQPLAVADGTQSFPDPSCPVTEDDGTTLTLSGGCSDQDGAAWLGAASVERSRDGGRTLVFENFGTRPPGKSADTRNGTASLTPTGDDTYAFRLTLVHDADIRTTFDYEGTVLGDYGTRTVWSGSGTVTREGPLPPVGTVSVSTAAEVLDDVCGQPASGNTTIQNDPDETVVVTYDGAVDCDDAQAASYSLNGAPQGTITGITCALHAGPSHFEHGTVAAALLSGLLLVARRRRGKRRPGPALQG
jgi:hypothetical protein